jgi:hypothetical protein
MMADRVPKIRQEEKPTFDAAVYSDRLQETRTVDRPVPGVGMAKGLAPVQVFDKTSPSSIVPLARYVNGKLTDTVNALTEFTAAHEVQLNAHTDRLNTQNDRITALENAPALPFPQASG